VGSENRGSNDVCFGIRDWGNLSHAKANKIKKFKELGIEII
jgi:hypothetical protein